MSIPKILETPQGYTYSWTDEQITIEASRLRQHSDGRVTGEIVVKTTVQNVSPHLHQAQFNFNSTAARDKLTKLLTGRYSAVDWYAILEQTSVYTLERLRQGEPVKELWTNEDIKAPEFLLEPLLYKGLPTITFGEKAVWKSGLGLVVYACLTLPWNDNPLGWTAPSRSITALLADYETDYNVVQYNAKRLQIGMDLPAFPVYYRRCSLPLADDIEQIQRHMTSIGAEVLIVDSLGPAVGGDLKDPGQALRFTSALRRLVGATLIIGQTSKDKETKVKSVFGSTFFEYYARNIYELRKSQEEGEDTLDIALYNTYNNLGRRHKPMGFQLYFNENKVKIDRQEITAPELLERLGIQTRILSLLKSGSMSNKEIREALETTKGNTDMAIKRLRDKSRIIKAGDGWGLPFGGC